MRRQFLVVSGLPGSGKSTLAQRLATALGLALLDKDDILERLFEAKGLGDAAWRRAVSRESDLILEAEASASTGAVIVSHWHLPGMAADSGTPTGWIAKLAADVIHVHCQCPAEIAAERFALRRRHPGHLDDERSSAEILESILGLASLRPLEIGPRIDVDTSQAIELDGLLRKIRAV